MACGGGRGSELLRLRPACQVSSVAGAGTGAGVARSCREVGLRIRIEPLRTLCVVEGGVCGCEDGDWEGGEEGVWVVVVIVGDVVVVDCGPEWWTVVPCPGSVEVVVVVVCGPEVVVVETVEDASGCPCSPCPLSMIPSACDKIAPREKT
jgi:hypothetical protein